LFVKDVIVLVNLCLTDGGSPHLVISPVDSSCFATGVNTGQWKRMYDGLVARFDGYPDALLRNIRKFIRI